MLNHATGDEAIFLKFMLGSGFRDQEAQHVCWRDLDFLHSQVRVTAKARWDFRPKNWEERVVPLPSALIDQLQRLKEIRNALPTEFVFPNKRGNPNRENDTIVKRVAYRAKLNCGQCVTKHGNKYAQGPYCQHFFLHKSTHICYRAPAARCGHPYASDVDGPSRHQIDHGVPEGGAIQRRFWQK